MAIRKSTGLKLHKCYQCATGWIPGQVKTFEPECAGCQKKLKAGLRTGKEPRPPSPGNQGKKRLSPAAWTAHVAGLKRGAAARRGT